MVEYHDDNGYNLQLRTVKARYFCSCHVVHFQS
jgi:hypothetical protein